MFGKRSSSKNKNLTLFLAMLMVVQVFLGGFGSVTFAEGTDDIELSPVETPPVDKDLDDTGEITTDPITKGSIILGEEDSDKEPIDLDIDKEKPLEMEKTSPSGVEMSLMGGPVLMAEPQDLSGVGDFNYELNLYGDGKLLVESGTIEIENLTTLEYRVDFTINDGFIFENNEYLELDISSLTKLGELKLPEDQESGRIIFKVGDSEIDAAKYSIEGDILKITFDNGSKLNGKKGRKGHVSLLFNVEKSNSESELVEEIQLKDKETKTFFIKRSNANVNTINKEGEYKEAEDYIEWTIDVNTELSSLTNSKLIDDIPTGLNVEKIEIINLKVTTKNIVKDGAWEEVSLSDTSKVNFENKKLTLALGNLNRKAKRIRIRTSIDDSYTGDLEFTNYVSLIDNETIKDTDSHTLSFNRVTGITKSGVWKNNNEIEWEIEFRGNSNEGVSDLEDIFTMPSNTKLVLDEDSVKLNGAKFTKEDIKFSTENPNKVIFKDIPNSTETQKLKYTTKVIFESDYNDEDINISNSATYNSESTGASVTGKRGEYVSKDDGSIYGENRETYIKWNIVVNKNKESWKNVTITETIPDGFEFVNAKIENEELSTETNPNTGIVTITVGKITEQKTVVVTTKLKEGYEIDDINNSVKNKATINYYYDYSWGVIGGGISEGPYTENVEGNFSKIGFNHTLSKKSSNLNYKEQTIDWEVDYKTYNNDVDGLTIQDTLTGEQVYKKGSFSLTLNGQVLSLSTPSAVGLTFVLEEKSFEINLPSTLENSKTYNNIVLTYKTKFDLKNMDDQDSEIILNNNVKITNDSEDISDDSPISLKKWISKNGQKSKSKELGDNRIFNWEVQLNPKGKTIGNDKTIVDTLTGMQKYLKESIKIYRAELQANGTLIKVQDGELNLLNDYTIVYSDSTKKIEGSDKEYVYHSGMVITFKNDLKTPIILEYQTEAVGISEEYYKNSVAYNNKEYSADIKYDKHNQHITKELLNDRNGKVVKGDILKWKLTINSNLSEIYNFKLEDVMSEGLKFIPGSLVISPSLEGEESFKKEDLDGPNLGREGYKLTKDFVDKKYVIEYETLVFVDPDKSVSKISNDVYISGYSLKKDYENQSVFDLVGRSQAGGSGYDDNEYDVTIIKVDADTGNRINKEVKFKLITETKIGENIYILEEELVTDNNGEITITLEENAYNTYYLEEVKAPTGYVMDPERIEITKSDSSEIRVENSKIKIDITGSKVWKGGPRPKIDLQLYRNNVTLGEPITLVSGKTEYTWKNLDKTDNAGVDYIYTVKEVETPENYKKVEEGLTVTNTYVIPKTDVIVAKEWLGGPEAKPEIELQLYQNGVALEDYRVILASGILTHKWTDLDLTDENGVNHIYTVDEVKVPNYYVKRISQDGFTVTNVYSPPSSPSDPEGRIRIIKKDRDSNELLSKAEFDILDSKGKRVDTLTTNSKGEATSIWLPIGEYTIEEKKAPKGYKLDTKLGRERVRNRETIEIEIYNEKEPEEPVIPIEPTDPDPIDPTAPTDPTEPNKPDKPNKPGESEEFEDFDNGNPAGGTNIDGPKPLLPKTGSQSTIFLLIMGVAALTLGLMLKIKKITKMT